MKTLPLSEAKAQLSRLIDQVAATDEQIMITRNGPPAASSSAPTTSTGAWRRMIELIAIGSRRTIYAETLRRLRRQ